jgi:hypothetical protein
LASTPEYRGPLDRFAALPANKADPARAIYELRQELRDVTDAGHGAALVAGHHAVEFDTVVEYNVPQTLAPSFLNNTKLLAMDGWFLGELGPMVFVLTVDGVVFCSPTGFVQGADRTEVMIANALPVDEYFFLTQAIGPEKVKELVEKFRSHIPD